MDHEQIRLISRLSSWSENGIESQLKKNVYLSEADAGKFLILSLLIFGLGFLLSGLFFFFAYNWNAFDKVTKFSLVEGFFFVCILAAWFLRKNGLLLKCALLTASVAVGILFAVYGQIYQTEAVAFDFFLAWTLFTLIWTLVADFPVLWLGFFLLLNTTLILYFNQVYQTWSFPVLMIWLVLLNGAITAGTYLIPHWIKKSSAPIWLKYLCAFATGQCATIGLIYFVLNDYSIAAFPLVILSLIIYPLYWWYAYQVRERFYLAVVCFWMFTFVNFYVMFTKGSLFEMKLSILTVINVSAIYFVSRFLIKQKKIWSDERRKSE